MPSIPQSLLWISLVVLWLFVLVPMLASKRDTVRRTSDVALATRVLNSTAAARLLKRGGPAAGHRSDPDWRRENRRRGHEDEDLPYKPGSSVVLAANTEPTEPVYLDVDIVGEDSGVLPVGDRAEAGSAGDVAAREDAGDDVAEPKSGDDAQPGAQDAEPDAGYTADDAGGAEIGSEVPDPAPDTDTADAEDAGDADDAENAEDAGEYEYVADSSGLEAAEDSPTAGASPTATAAARRHRYDSKTAAAVSARKYNFRKRVLMAMGLVLMVSAALTLTVAPGAWWLCGGAAGMTVLYLAYLRRQTRIEERVRARRMRRMARPGAEARAAERRESEVVPSQLRRPGAVVLETDDEDPIFEHLEPGSFAGEYDWRGDLPRAAGQ